MSEPRNSPARDVARDVGNAEELRHDQAIGPVDLTRWSTPPGRALAGTAEKASRNVGTRGALILTLVIGGAIAIALSFVASRIYDSVTEADGVAGLDLPILNFMMSLRSPLLDTVVTGYTDIAGPIGMPILAVVAILILSLRRRSWTPAILIAAAGIGSLLMTIAGKDIIGRHRPPLIDAVPPYEYSPSFPSGHTLNALVVAGVVAYLLILRRSTTHGRVITIVVAAVFALTIGLSRVFLGHHWFTDVLAAWVLGAAWLALIITAHRLYITVKAGRVPRVP
ncbi:MAG: phosphatase PAP2 family protein [Actinomycetota bacterium]|nr:phosphatase PAP2 family protein [Actinomycetota bacterium]